MHCRAVRHLFIRQLVMKPESKPWPSLKRMKLGKGSGN